MKALSPRALRPLVITAAHMRRTVPQADRMLDGWRQAAERIPDPALRRQALESIDHKRFHCQGGALFATWAPKQARRILEFIIPFQTISDYLDNLCDRTASFDEADFRTLHESMLEAADLGRTPGVDYYAHHPNREDGGYLTSLVSACRAALGGMPHYPAVREAMLRYVSLYVDLQVLKHLQLSKRVGRLEAWFADVGREWSELFWWEFAAASGSTLLVFALASEAARPEPLERRKTLERAYFPWICGIHILLDYFIDQQEDVREEDLNFVSFYREEKQVEERMKWFVGRAREAAASLEDAPFHACVIEGLLGLYLSDPKVARQGLDGIARALLRQAGWRAEAVYRACRIWRKRRRYKEGMTS